MYLDTSTGYVTATTSASLLSTAIMTSTPSPTSNIEPPDVQEMESNAVVMSLKNITIQQVSHFTTLSLSYTCCSGCK